MKASDVFRTLAAATLLFLSVGFSFGLVAESWAYTDLTPSVTPEILKHCKPLGEVVAGVSGDVNGDGVADYLLLSNGPGYRSGDIWVIAAVSSPKGFAKVKPIKVSAFSVDSVSLANGVLTMKGRMFQVGDALCCPSKEVGYAYKYQKGSFVKTQ